MEDERRGKEITKTKSEKRRQNIKDTRQRTKAKTQKTKARTKTKKNTKLPVRFTGGWWRGS
jgi:hypothetical protein